MTSERRFRVGEMLAHSSPTIGESAVEFRGYHRHPETAELLARVIFRRPGEWWEDSVRPEELKRGLLP